MCFVSTNPNHKEAIMKKIILILSGLFLFVFTLSGCGTSSDGGVMGTDPTTTELQVGTTAEYTVASTSILAMFVSEGYDFDGALALTKMSALPKAIRESASYTFDNDTITEDCDDAGTGTGTITLVFNGSSTYDVDTEIGSADMQIDVTLANCEQTYSYTAVDDVDCASTTTMSGTFTCDYTSTSTGTGTEMAITCNTPHATSGLTISWGGTEYEIGLSALGGSTSSGANGTSTGVLYIDGVGYYLDDIEAGMESLASSEMTCD